MTFRQLPEAEMEANQYFQYRKTGWSFSRQIWKIIKNDATI